jgi:uncharacterized protein (TIGR02145 family)
MMAVRLYVVLLVIICCMTGLSAQDYDTIIDHRDGQLYKVVKIGAQWWFAENLNFGKRISGKNQTDNDTIEKYCYNDSESNCNYCGGLYQWNEMMQYTTTESTQGICPDGWHIPSDSEFKELEIYLGMSQATADLTNTWRGSPIGTMMKVGGSTGFDDKLCGRRPSGGGYYFMGSYGYPYTSTQFGNNAWRRCLGSSATDVGRWNTFTKDYAFSLRCVTYTEPVTIGETLKAEKPTIAIDRQSKTITIMLEQFSEVEVYNLLGNRIYVSESPTLTLEGVKPGVYILKIRDNVNRYFTKKVMLW